MNSNELHACFTMDCEQIDSLADQRGPVTWELGERSIRGYCETLLEHGLGATLFIVPQAAERYRTTLLELAGAGIELGLHYHPQDHGYPDFFGAFTSEEQDQMLREAMDQWSQALGLTPFVFRPGNFSANDATFSTLVRLGFLAGSVSLPQRNFMEARKMTPTGSAPPLTLILPIELIGCCLVIFLFWPKPLLLTHSSMVMSTSTCITQSAHCGRWRSTWEPTSSSG